MSYERASLSAKNILLVLEILAKENKIRMLDYQYARFIHQFDSNGLVILAAAMASYQSGQGHVCVNLTSPDLSPLFGLNEEDLHRHIRPILHQLPEGINHWHHAVISALQSSGVQGVNAPLVLSQQRLYLQRYWLFEQQISQFLHQRSQTVIRPDIAQNLQQLFAIDIHACWQQLTKMKSQQLSLANFCHDYFYVRDDIDIDRQALSQYLTNITSLEQLQQLQQQFTPDQCIDWQQIAVAQACANNFSVISGGPGTGKTTTVTKLLALLVQMAQRDNTPLSIELVAPTGKAAARLTESISGAVNKLQVSEQIKQAIPTHASTIHRLLGVIPNRVDFKHHRKNPLHIDVLIVDEASMIDISLMAKLLDAIAAQTKLILLGDKDQLSSVEAGAVFADICEGIARGPNYSAQAKHWLYEQTGFNLAPLCARNTHQTVIDDGLCVLQKSYRFNEKSGIGALAKAINHSDIGALKRVWQQGFTDISLHSGDNIQQATVALAVAGYQTYLAQAKQVSTLTDVDKLLASFNEFQLLTPVRTGIVGVEQLNQTIEQQLARHQHISLAQGAWYVGRPVMIVSNDHSQQLFNGDIGIVLPPLTPESQLTQNRVYFKMASGEIKSFLPSRLPEHETVYAMTIHKSQGSEFDHVVMAMPSSWSPLLTKELVYTGVTRAKKSVELFSDVGVLQKAALTKTVRFSGLKHLLNKDVNANS